MSQLLYGPKDTLALLDVLAGFDQYQDHCFLLIMLEAESFELGKEIVEDAE